MTKIRQGKERFWDKQGTKRRQAESLSPTALESVGTNSNSRLSDRVLHDSFTVSCFRYEKDRVWYHSLLCIY